MKLTYEDKVLIYELRKEEMTELERLQAENAVLKKMRELRIVVFGSIIRGFSG